MADWKYTTEFAGERKCEFVACPDCGRNAMQGRDKFLSHRKYGCSLVKEQPPRSFFFPEEAAALAARASEVPAMGPSASQIAEAARRGDLRQILSDDEIVQAARLGLISGDEAMNQDF